MLWLPPARVLVLQVPCPLTRVTVARVVLPSRNVTVPVGVPDPGLDALTVAMNVTAAPGVAGFAEDVTVVLLAS